MLNGVDGKMAVLYIKEQGAYVQKQGECITVTKGGKQLFKIPLIKIDNISLIGNVQITSQALQILLKKGIDVHFFSYSGEYLGRMAAESSKNIFIRFEQYGFYLQMNRRLDMAKIIIDNKIHNQMNLICRHRWNNSDYDWKRDVAKMEYYLSLLPEKNTSNEILGIEGICSNIYFSAFGHMLKCDFTFSGRNRRPPKDPVNVLISLTYTFLTKEVSSALDAESFEAYLGFLHGIRYGRKSLALDMMEEFRQPVADRLVMLLFNKRIIGKYDFDYPENDKIILNEEGFRKFCVEYEKWMDGRNTASGEKSFRRIIQNQANKLKKAIMQKKDYVPYRWKEDGDVHCQLRYQQ